MKVLHRIGRLLAGTTAIISFAAVLGSCAEHGFSDNYGGSDNGKSQKEAFTRAFIEEFGIFKGKPYSAATTGVVGVRTARPTVINVFADIEGERYIFASLGSVDGAQTVTVTIPTEVKELIVSADGEEHTVKLGDVLDLTNTGSRVGLTDWSFGTEVPSLNDFEVVVMKDEKREIGLTGEQLRDKWLKYNGNNTLTDVKGFSIFDSSHNFTKRGEKLFPMSRFMPNNDNESDITVYPLYWRNNVYGENDYLLGIYYYNENIAKSTGDKVIKMIDLDGFTLKDAISFKKTGESSYTVSQTGQAYEPRNINTGDNAHFKGYHFKMKNVKKDGEVKVRMGFYIKSGLKDTSTPEGGRDYTHITFQNGMFNAKLWGDDSWDTTLKDIGNSYSGAIFSMDEVEDKPERVDGLTPTKEVLGTDERYYNIIGFNFQPKGIMSDVPDYSDVVLAMTYNSMEKGREMSGKGDTFETFPWFLASEDLGSTDDWDFNDIVVTIYDVTTDLTREYLSNRGYYPCPSILGRRITVVPRAAGSTIPIYLIYEGKVSKDATDDTFLSSINAKFESGVYVVGTEIHEWLGEPDYTQMLNTGYNDGYDGCGISFCVPIKEEDEPEFDIHNLPLEIGMPDRTMRNFWILVDKDDKMRAELSNPLFDPTPLQPEYKSTKIRRHKSQSENVLKAFSGKLGQGAYRVDPPNEEAGEVPQMIMCRYVWRWPKERQNIGDAYTSFRDWVAGDRTTWHGNPGPGECTNEFHPEMLCEPVKISWMQ